MSAVIHIAGSYLQIGPQFRQRCAWCGATLIDTDLRSIAVPEGTDPTPGHWEPGALVAVEGTHSYVVPHVDGERLPSTACAQLDHEVTR